MPEVWNKLRMLRNERSGVEKYQYTGSCLLLSIILFILSTPKRRIQEKIGVVLELAGVIVMFV